MSTGLAIFDQLQANVPAHVAKFLETESNIADRVTVPSLSYEGKVWTISANGEKIKLMKRDADGDEVPVSVMRIVVLDYAKRRGRAYYEGAYDPGKAAAPLCWSEDGVAPDSTVSEPRATKCDTCPLAAKGSKVTEQGKSVAACSQHRMLVVVPGADLGFTPLRLKIAVTSDWDKNSPEWEQQGWFAFSNFTDYLRSKNVAHTAALVTKVRFDPNVAYPKLLFSPDRWLDDSEIAQVAPVTRSEAVAKLLGGTFTPNGADGVAKAETAAAGAAASTPADPKPASLDDDDDAPAPSEQLMQAAAAQKKTRKKAEPKAAEPEPVVAATKAAVSLDDDDDAPVVQTKAAAAPAKDSAISPELAKMLADWGED